MLTIVKMTTMVGILKFICMINTSLKSRKFLSVFKHFDF